MAAIGSINKPLTFLLPAIALLVFGYTARAIDGTLRVSDMHGRIIRRSDGAPVMRISAETLPPGTYALRFSAADGQCVARLVTF